MRWKQIWKPFVCFLMVLIIGTSGIFMGALPAYGETAAAEEAESVLLEEGDVSEAETADCENTEPEYESTETDYENIEPDYEDTESDYENTEPETEKTAGSDEAFLYDATSGQEAESGLKLTVTYPNDIKCGTPVTFTMHASGGSGNYQYRIHSLLDSELTSVYDVSWGNNSAYSTSNEYAFTFYASGTYYIRFNVMDMSTGKYVNTGMFEYPVVIKDDSYPSVEQIVNDLVAECEGKYNTDFDKAVWLHDWIMDHATYDNSFSYCSAEGVLARGTGTCESYHRAYVKLLEKAGIQTGRVKGNGHVWTAVKLDGDWYQVDPTWDDEAGYRKHLYFGLTDYLMGLAHSDHVANSAASGYGYPSTSLENNYFIKTGEISQWSDAFTESIEKNIAAGQTSFELPIPSNAFDTYETDIIYNLVAYELSRQSLGGKQISVLYKNRKLLVDVENTVSVPQALRIVPPSKTVYKKGEAVNTSGLTVTVIYSGGTKTEQLSGSAYRLEGFDTNTVGTRTATITYQGLSAVFKYTVEEPSTKPVTPTNPVKPTTPVTPTNPVTPTKPVTPTNPVKPTTPVTPSVPNANIRYRTHVQSYGWQDWKQNGVMSGTSGEAKRLEGIKIELVGPPVSGGVEYRTHIQSYGWESGWKQNGAMSGTSGERKRLEAIQIRLTGKMAEQYDIYYRVHAQSFGWLGWAKNGASAGTAGYAKRLEGIEICLVKKGGKAPGSSINSFKQAGADAGINYRTHVQSYGWQDWRSNGAMSGTSGEAKRLEGIEIRFDNLGVSGGVEYRTHIQTYGWENGWKSNGAMSGTSGEAKRLEAIQIRLTGDAAKKYDIYYRVHAQSFGWLDWAKNGGNAGTAGYAKRLEGIEIRLVEKGGKAPGSTARAYVAR